MIRYDCYLIDSEEFVLFVVSNYNKRGGKKHPPFGVQMRKLFQQRRDKKCPSLALFRYFCKAFILIPVEFQRIKSISYGWYIKCNMLKFKAFDILFGNE